MQTQKGHDREKIFFFGSILFSPFDFYHNFILQKRKNEGFQRQDSEVTGLINMWAAVAVQTKLEDIYRNRL